MTSIKGGAAGPSKENLPLSEPKATCKVIQISETHNPTPVRLTFSTAHLRVEVLHVAEPFAFHVVRGLPEAMTRHVAQPSIESKNFSVSSSAVVVVKNDQKLCKTPPAGLQEFKIWKLRELQRTLFPQNLTEGDLHFGLTLAGQTKAFTHSRRCHTTCLSHLEMTCPTMLSSCHILSPGHSSTTGRMNLWLGTVSSENNGNLGICGQFDWQLHELRHLDSHHGGTKHHLADVQLLGVQMRSRFL